MTRDRDHIVARSGGVNVRLGWWPAIFVILLSFPMPVHATSGVVLLEQVIYRRPVSDGFAFSASSLSGDRLAVIVCPVRAPRSMEVKQPDNTACTLIRMSGAKEPNESEVLLPGAMRIGIVELLSFPDDRLAVLFIQREGRDGSPVDSVGLLWEPFDRDSFVEVSDPEASVIHDFSGTAMGVDSVYVIWGDFREEYFSIAQLRREGWSKIFGRMVFADGKLGSVEQLCKKGKSHCVWMFAGQIPERGPAAMVGRETGNSARLELAVPEEEEVSYNTLERGLKLFDLCGFYGNMQGEISAAWIGTRKDLSRVAWKVFDVSRRTRAKTLLSEDASGCAPLRHLPGHGPFLAYKTDHNEDIMHTSPEDIVGVIAGPEMEPKKVTLLSGQRIVAFDALPRNDGTIELVTLEEREGERVLMRRVIALAQ